MTTFSKKQPVSVAKQKLSPQKAAKLNKIAKKLKVVGAQENQICSYHY